MLEEVDKIVQEFKETLYKSMEDPHIEVAQVRIHSLQGILQVYSLHFYK